MAINYPVSTDTLTNPTAGQKLNNPDHATQHANINDIAEALEAKVGVDSSAVVTSLDYLVKNTSSSDPGHKHTSSSLSNFDKIRLDQQLDISLTNNTVVPITYGNSSETYKSVAGMHSTSSNTSRVVIQTTGYYHMSGGIRFAGGNTTNRYSSNIRVNGTTLIGSSEIPATATSVYVNVSCDNYLTAGDYVELCGFQVTGGDITAQAVAGQTFFAVHKIP